MKQDKLIDVKILSIINCQATPATVALIEATAREMGVAIALSQIIVATREDAAQYAFPGSPTVLVNGLDIEPLHETCGDAAFI